MGSGLNLLGRHARPLPREVMRESGRRPSQLRRQYRVWRTAFRLLLNWGVLIAAVATVLVVRQRPDVPKRPPLPPPHVSLAAADSLRWQAFPGYHGVIPVLLYHGVGTANASAVGRPTFAEQMLALRTAGFHAITLDQYVRFAHGDDKGLPAKPILITFDDGLATTYRAANSILRKYGFHATMFTFGAWPIAHPGFDLTWNDLRSMRRSGIWSVAEDGGSGHRYVVFNAAGDRGGADAFRRYVKTREGGHLEPYPSFVRRVTSGILWGERQFAVHLPGFSSLAFAVPAANYGQLRTNDPRIPSFLRPWLDRHFSVVFGGDYLNRPGTRHTHRRRFTPDVSYGISVSPRMSLDGLYCRLNDWVTKAPIWREYRCPRRRSAPLQGPQPLLRWPANDVLGSHAG